MTSEIELKFRISPARLPALRRAVATRSARQIPLAAAYFDTAGDLLARGRTALRLRREGDGWVQTLKAEGANPMQRLEHNAPVPTSDPDQRPALDLARHQGSEAGQALQRLLQGAGGVAANPLTERYATEVLRTSRVLRRGAARIELAMDIGLLRAGGRQLPVCELEFELLQGTPADLLAEAGRWVDRFGLVLDLRSKSERGHRLALGHWGSPPASARPLRLPAKAPLAQAWAALLSNPLNQVLANASQLADETLHPAAPATTTPAAARSGPAAAASPSASGSVSPEHLHQLRVGLRRLRSVMRLWGHLMPQLDPALAPALGQLFTRLGAVRDQDAMAESLLPALQAAGAPLVKLPASPTGALAVADLPALLQAPATQHLWLALLGACQPVPGPAAAPAPAVALKSALAGPLHALLRQVQRSAARFATLDDNARHRLRRRCKRLRYGLALSTGLWPAKPAARLLRRLEAVQDPLGELNDAVVAQALWQAAVAQDARAWFVVGWLTARRAALVGPCEAALQRLAACASPWPKGAGASSRAAGARAAQA